MARHRTVRSLLAALGCIGALGCGIAKHDSVPVETLPPGEPTCVYEGRRHPVGVFHDSDGNYCRCDETELVHCAPPNELCFAGGVRFPGETFSLEDDCTTCTCGDLGHVECDASACPTACVDFAGKHDAALAAAQVCDPGHDEQCIGLADAGLGCSCPEPVNATLTEELANLAAVVADYGTRCVNPRVECVGCDAAEGVAVCSAQGHCVRLSDPSKAACKVGGLIYPHGTENFSVPTSNCSSCMCYQGGLSCESLECGGDPCPSGSVYGKQCAVCSASSECLLFEFRCLPECGVGCSSGTCVDGLCKTTCE